MEKIKEVTNEIIENKWIHYIILIIVGIVLSLGLVNIQIKDTHDGLLHFLRTLGTEDTLKIGQFPPLINQNYCNGCGYAMNLFYPPLVTYLPLLIKLITLDYMVALKIFGALCIIGSGITMYHLVYEVTSNRIIALFSAFFYIISPYKLVNVYKRYAIGEFASMVFMPYVFLGLYNLFKKDGRKHYYIAIGTIGLILTHTITTLYTAIFCAIYVLFNIAKLKDIQILKKCIINGIFILLISLFFLGPFLEYTSSAKYAIMDNYIMSTNGNYVSRHTISLSHLVKNETEDHNMTFSLGVPTIIAMFLTLFTLKKVDDKYRKIYLLFCIFSIIALFMATKLFPWRYMPNILCKLQYPWRMLGFFAFFSSLVCGVNIYIILNKIIKKDYIKILIVTTLSIVAIVANESIMHQFYTDDNTRDKKYIAYILNDKKIDCKMINREYMPVNAIYLFKTYVSDRTDSTYILEGNAEILEENKENFTDIIKIKNISKDTLLEFPYYYYKGYEITVSTNEEDKKIAAIESKHGYLACRIEDNIEEATIKVEYKGTTFTYISYGISAISFIIFIVYIIVENRKGENNVNTKENTK